MNTLNAPGTLDANKTTCNILLCGVGGQGTVLASKLISGAAMAQGLAVKGAETIGMAQRGGSVTSHVRMGSGAFSPLIGPAGSDLLIGFEPAEAVRQLHFLREDGVAVVSNKPQIPATSSVGGPAYDLDGIMEHLTRRVRTLVVVDAEAAARDLGSTKCLNVVLLGAAVRTKVLPLTEDHIRDVLRARLPERFLELNLRALDWA